VQARAVVLTSLLLAVGCGGRSGGLMPTDPAPAVTLPPGAYRLAVYSAGIGCMTLTFGQGALPGASIRIPVAVASDGEHWHVASRDDAAGSLEMDLAPNVVGVNGQAWGTLTQPGMSVTLQHQVSGSPNGPAAGLVGSVTGPVSYDGAAGSVYCTTNLWSLTVE
jgi:hypothetical protein